MSCVFAVQSAAQACLDGLEREQEEPLGLGFGIDLTIVDDLSVTISSGRVTALLGPNGAGKSTVMRMILGQDHPWSGTAQIDGRRYATLRHRCVR